jgi:mitochondrial inner membrane protease subunit 2
MASTMFHSKWFSVSRSNAKFVVKTSIITISWFAFGRAIWFDFHGVTGVSMSPTLSPSYHETGSRDYICTIKRFIPGKWLEHVRSNLKRGDVVTMWKPHTPEEVSVKRVIGLPGDTIIRDVRRVGKQREQQGKYSKDMGMSVLPPVVKVPVGHIWVEGDNWRNTRDSNDFGPVSFEANICRYRNLMSLVGFIEFGHREGDVCLLALEPHWEIIYHGALQGCEPNRCYARNSRATHNR